ncbi:Basigin [Halotydeus destructor]|nr:Basigin [Halotydeus destructor]
MERFANVLNKNLLLSAVCCLILAEVISGKVVTNVEPGRGGIELLASKKVLVLQCNHTGSTDATPTWLKDGEDVSALEESLRDRIQTFPANRSLVITKLLNSVKRLETKLEGIYTCRFEDGETGEINVRSRPDIVINEGDSASKIDKSLNVVEGEGISLTCKVPPTNKDEGLKLSWLIGEDLDSLRPYSSDVSNENNTVGITRLVIAAADYEDRAYYVCRADNGVTAPVDYSVLVRVKDKLAALWPFLGIVGEVLILCTVIFIYEKRRDKPDFEESDTDNTENKSPQSTSKGQEIRQRK